jgi:CRISPR-associated protein Cas2
MEYVVTYDISTESPDGVKRLRRVSQMCLNYGQRVQKSVFECRLDELGYAEFVRRMGELIHPTEDSVRIYHVHRLHGSGVVSLGKDVGFDLDDPLIL